MRTRWDLMPRRITRPGMLAGGDGSTLSLDFTAMSSLDSRFTFTRASTGTYINSAGLVTTMAAASTNDPTKARLDYHPTTLAPRGLLIEGSVTNLVLQSDTLPTPTNWVANALTRTNVSTVTPDGNTTATTCGLSHTGSGSFRSSPITVTASTAYTFSFWAKNNGGSVALYRAYNVSGSADIVAETSYFSQINGSTWTRVQFTFTTPVGCTSVYVYPLSQSSGTSNVLIWGAQLEAGSGASSYVASGASQGQRAAESCSMTGTNFSSWFNTIGTFVVEQELSGPFITSDRVGIGLGTYSSGTSSFGFFRNNTTTVGTAIWGSGGTGYQEGTISVATRSLARSGFTLDWSGATRSNRSFANGTVAASLVSTTGSITVDRMFIGANSATGTSANRDWINGHIRSIKFWPTVLPNATLQSLTA